MKLGALIAALTVVLTTTSWAATSEPIQPVPAASVKNVAMMELGKKLFFDPRLSKSGFISCNSCHNLSMGGTDNLQTSIGDHWQQGPINAPTVLNSSMNLAQFWDGRARDLKEQAGGPIANPGIDAIRAVANPAANDFLYFVAKGDGSHAFARTLVEHNANVARYQKP